MAETIESGMHLDRLASRRDTVGATLRYIQQEQATVQKQSQWMDQEAYQSRMALFEDLTEWYSRELAEIEEAIKQFEQHTYKICRACDKPIDGDRLDCFPETAFCDWCEYLQER